MSDEGKGMNHGKRWKKKGNGGSGTGERREGFIYSNDMEKQEKRGMKRKNRQKHHTHRHMQIES
jgi:hypothetical protein